MKTLVTLGVLVAALSSVAAAQQPQMQHDSVHAMPGMVHDSTHAMPMQHAAGMGGMMNMESMHAMMARHDSLDQALSAKLDLMHAARGTARVDAMAAVIDELVAQRKAMRGMMHEMMMGMMHREN